MYCRYSTYVLHEPKNEQQQEAYYVNISMRIKLCSISVIPIKIFSILSLNFMNKLLSLDENR